MSLIKISLFFFLVILITVLQTATTYIYFSGFFGFRRRWLFIAVTFIYMLIIKILPSEFLVRIALLFVFLAILSAIALFGSIEKKIYHVLSFTFSLTLCELTFSTINGMGIMNIQTEYLRGITVYFLVNILFLLFIIAIIKFLMYFKEKNGDGLNNKEYILLSIIPLASLIIISVLVNVPYLIKIISCICLIFINISYIIIFDRIAKKNYEIHRFSVIEEQNHYYKEKIANQQEVVRMRHDLKNILITMDSFVLKKDVQAVKEQINALLETKVMCHDEFTGSVVIDSILNAKLQKIKENNIKYTLNFQIPNDLKIKDNNIVEVSSILGNLLDNAIEAVLRLEKDKEKIINVAIQYNTGKLIFDFQNTSNPVLIDFSHTLIKSEKEKDRYGIGISSIKERVDRLNGYYDFGYKEGKYTALIVLPIENN